MLTNFKDWTEVTKGLYRYAISANACYEVHLIYYEEGTDILAAKANLYIAGDWYTNDSSFFDREFLLLDATVADCLEEAERDNNENNE